MNHRTPLADMKRRVWFLVSDRYGNLAHVREAETQYPNYRGEILMFGDDASAFQTYAEARQAIRRTLTCSKRHGYNWSARGFKIRRMRLEVSRGA